MRGVLAAVSIAGGLTLFSIALHAEDLPGKIIYEAHCSVCHGPQGKGDGPSSRALIPRPPDFTDPAIKAAMTKEGIIEAITNGKRGTQMEGWKDKLSPQDIHSVMEYVQSLR